MRILITNLALTRGSGTETLVRDLAPALRDRGHTVICYAPHGERLADEIRGQGIAVPRSIADIAEPPDIIHGQHTGPTLAALARFPGVPAVYVVQDWSWPWDQPPAHPRVRRYLYVRDTLRERLVSEAGVAPEQIAFWPNGIDLKRLGEPKTPPTRPVRAAAYTHPDAIPFLDLIEQACSTRGIAFDGAIFSRRGEPEPEAALEPYDLVFATGRMAIEALAAGLAVICTDRFGIGGLVTTAELESFQACNFAPGARSRKASVSAIGAALDCYDAADVAAVTARVRQGHDIRQTAALVEEQYRLAMVAQAADPPSAEAEALAMARYIEGATRGGELLDRHAQRHRVPRDEVEHLSVQVAALGSAVGDLVGYARRLTRFDRAVGRFRQRLRDLLRRP